MKQEKPCIYIEARDGYYYLRWSDGLEPFTDPIPVLGEAVRLLRLMERIHALKRRL